MRFARPIIIGGGPAGSAAAIRLARAGAQPMLIERLRTPGDALCGGFLSWATIGRIEALGIDATQLGGHPIAQLALFAGGRERRLPLPRTGMGLSRHRLDSLMLATAQAAGAHCRIGTTVRTLSPGRMMLADGEEQGWDSLFLATGKHDLRGVARPHGGAEPELGLRVRLAPSPALTRLIGDRIELHRVEGGYVGLLLQEDGSANLCMAIRKSHLTRVGGRPLALLHRLADSVPALADRLADLSDDARIDAIGDVPYGWRAREGWTGLYRLGDQAAVIPSLAGEGMGIALASAEAAVHRWTLDGAAGAAAYQRDFAARAATPLRAAAALRTLLSHPRWLGVLTGVPGVMALAIRLTRMA